MNQQQIRVSFSVGSKLILSVVSILCLVITFLSISTIYLFREDKRAYTYQTQSTEALLVGKEFVVTSNHAIDTLRTLMATIDPHKTPTTQQINSLQSIVDNQTEILGATISLVNLKTKESKLYSETPLTKEVEKLQLNLKNYQISSEWMETILPELIQKTYAFINLAHPGEIPILGVILADINLKDNPDGMPVALGLVSLKNFGSEVNNLKLTIATRSGWVLFDSDPTTMFSKENIDDNPLFKVATQNQMTNGAQEYDFEGTHFLGSFVLPGLDLVILTKTEWQKAMMATYLLIEKFILLGSMAIGVTIIFSILFSKTLTAPIELLYNATKEVAKGNFSIHVEEKGRDELSALSTSFNIMSSKIGELIKESTEKVKLENEIAIASTVQQTLIPVGEFNSDALQIFSHYESASQCGGDWWGFFGVNNRIAVMIADATGHGFPSALITAAARSCFSFMHKLAQEDPEFTFSPSAMLSFANRVIFDASLSKIMMTFFVCVIDLENHTLTYSSAGHNPPWLFTTAGNSFESKSLVAKGQRLGESRDCPEFEEQSTSFTPGDLLFLYTDGLVEGKNSDGEPYGKKRVRKWIETHLKETPKDMVTGLIAEFSAHNSGKSLDDDVTVAAIRLQPERNANPTNA